LESPQNLPSYAGKPQTWQHCLDKALNRHTWTSWARSSGLLES